MDLARTMVRIGEGAGKRMVALITAMDQPLGRAVGNALEVREAVETLSGHGPGDLTELVLALGGEMLVLSGQADTPALAREMLQESLGQGKGPGQAGPTDPGPGRRSGSHPPPGSVAPGQGRGSHRVALFPGL